MLYLFSKGLNFATEGLIFTLIFSFFFLSFIVTTTGPQHHSKSQDRVNRKKCRLVDHLVLSSFSFTYVTLLSLFLLCLCRDFDEDL